MPFRPGGARTPDVVGYLLACALVAHLGCGASAPDTDRTRSTQAEASPPDVDEPYVVPPEYAPGPISAEAGEAYFGRYGVGDPYGAGIPYPLLRGMMALYPDHLGRDFHDFNARFGTLPNEERPDDPEAPPVGFHLTRDPNTGVRFAMMNCRVCHAGVAPTAEGDQAVTGLGNRTLRIHAYVAALSRVVSDPALTPARLIRAADAEAKRLDLSWRPEYRRILSDRLLRELRRRLEPNRTHIERLADGLPGRVATMEGFMLAMNMHLGTSLELPETTGWARIPDVLPFRHRETNSFDGAASGAPVALVAEADFVFGVRPRWYEQNRHIATSMLMYLRSLERDLPFPGTIDAALATRGYDAFEASCAKCHGHYARPGDEPRVSYTERVIPLGLIGTDRARVDAVTDALVAEAARVEATRGLVRTRRTGGYVPRPLVNVWARGHYGHNGQWPDLTVLATSPEDRPRRFAVAPRAPLDLERLGQRWRPLEDDDHGLEPGEYLYDASRPGHGVQGHTFLSKRPPPERQAILEYLKTL
jgi:hypothetical protein